MLGFGSLVSTALVDVPGGGTPPVAVVGVETYSIGRFTPTQLKRPVDLYYNSDVEPFFAVETNVHFLAKYVPTKYVLRPNLQQHQDFNPPVVSPEPHFIGHYKPTFSRFLQSLIQHTANDITFVAIQPETNIHFISKFKPTRINVLQQFRSCPANDIPAFVARYNFYTQIFG